MAETQFIEIFNEHELGDLPSSLTIGDIRDRINAHISSGVPEDTRLRADYDETYLRDKFGFCVDEDLTKVEHVALLARLLAPGVSRRERGAVIEELQGRLAKVPV